MQLTSAVECTHRSLLEDLWLRVHRSPHQEQQILKYNGKGRITQMQLTSAVECTHRSLSEELWLRVHRSPHQEQRLLKYNGKGRITQNTAEQSTVKESNAIKIIKFSVSVTIYSMPHDSQRAKTLHYITSHFTLYSVTLQLTLYISYVYARGFKHTHMYTHLYVY